MMITTAISASIFAWKKLRILNINFVKEKLFKKELCFKCKKLKHKACNCFKSVLTNAWNCSEFEKRSVFVKVVTESDILISCFISMSDNSFDFKSFIVNIILNSLEKIFRSFTLINTEVTDMIFIDESLMSELCECFDI